MNKNMEARWDESNSRWEASLGSGKNRVWFRSRKPGDAGKDKVEKALDDYLNGPAAPLPGTLAEFVETVWWPRVQMGCTQSTIDGYYSILMTHLAPWYGYQLNAITLELMQPWVAGIQASPKRVKNIFGVMGAILELASLTGRYERKDHKLVILPEVVKRKARTDLTQEVVDAILSAAEGRIVYGPIWASAYLGLRRNEVCGLKRGHIAFEGESAIITLQDNRQKHGETQKLKGKRKGDTRVLTVPKEWGETLLSFAGDGIYLFPGGHGRPIHPDTITKDFKEIAAKVGKPHLTYHDMRAACNSNLRTSGVDPETRRDILGHVSIETTGLYDDVRQGDIQAALSKLTSRGDR